jgi:hypothetical protein
MRIRKVLGRLAAGLLLLAALPAALLLCLLLEPQWFLTSKTVGRAIERFGRAYSPRWSRFDFAIRSPDVFEKEITASAAGFCFAAADGSMSGCFKRVDARFTVALAANGVRVTGLALDVEGETLRVAESARAAKPAAAGGGRFDPLRLPRLIPAPLRGIRIEKAAIDLPSVVVAGSSSTTRASLLLSFDPALIRPLTFSARWAARAGGVVRRGRARVSAASDFFKTGQLTYLDAAGSVAAEGAAAEFSAKARQAGPSAVSVEAEASGRRKALSFRFRGGGVQTPERYALKGSFSVDAATGPLRGLRLQPFDFTAARSRDGALPDSFRFEAALRAEPAALLPVRGFAPPRFLTGRLTVNARSSPTRLERDHFDAELAVILNPYMSWFEAHADLLAQASGRTGDLSRVKIRERLDANAVVARFEDLVAFLAGGPFAVPAPVSALKGAVRASFSARGEPGSDHVEFDYRARADLAGQKQRLKFRVAGGGAAVRLMEENRSIEARAAATLDDVAFQLPHLDALKMPKVTLDPRIKSAGGREEARRADASREVAGSTSSVSLSLTVATARPILLYTDLAKSPVPVALDLKLEKPPGEASGTVGVQAFDVELFRRRAAVDHVTLTLRPDSKLVDLDGLIKYKADEAMISIRLLGTTDKPQVVFESDPPLSQSDIIAMLVFGKSPNALDADQAASVANAQTAMSDKAFGLASLYLFASTPIQFVGYDPASKSYTMKFRIPGGETLSISSDFDSTKSVQLRKRLSRHFAVAAEAVNSQTRGNGVVTFLEWFTRY